MLVVLFLIVLALKKSTIKKNLATKIYDLATKFSPLVASWLTNEKVNFEPCCQMPPNTQVNMIKRSHKQDRTQFKEEVQDCKDGSGLQLIFGQDVQKSKAAILVKF